MCWMDQYPELTLDWKTSARPRGPDLVDNYLDQLAAYRAAIRHTYLVTPQRVSCVLGDQQRRNLTSGSSTKPSWSAGS